MYNYSIIIPHKNIPDLLERCIYSIPVRDDIQIIIVDDNSSSSIVDFDNFPGLRRKNTEVIFTKEGRGAGFARNIALSRVKGKWILFCDADDFYMESTFDKLDLYVKTNYDLIYYKICSVDSETYKPANRYYELNHYIDEAISGNNLNLRFRVWFLWNRMFSSNYVRKYKLQFEEVPKGNDILFGLLSNIYAMNNFTIINDILYCITYRADSTTMRKYNKAELLLSWKSLEKVNSIYQYLNISLGFSYLRLVKKHIKLSKNLIVAIQVPLFPVIYKKEINKAKSEMLNCLKTLK